MNVVFHGSNNQQLKLTPVKAGLGYHVGAGPVEFLGPCLTTDKTVAKSYGKYVYGGLYEPKNPKKFKNLLALKQDIDRSFGTLNPGDIVNNLGAYYKDIAESYRIKLLSEGYDSVLFNEGQKYDSSSKLAITIIPIEEELPELILST